MFGWEVVMVSILGLLHRGHLVDGQKHHWTNVSRYMDVLCRLHDICKLDDESVNGPKRTKRIGFHCCAPCSCLPDCGLTQSCCYPELDTYKLVDRSHQPCIVPVIATRQTSDVAKLNLDTAYNMVVNSFPLKECVEASGIDKNCGDDETATPFGSLYPVNSKKTGRVYKNINCAKCHGLKDTDIVGWNTVLSCKDVDRNSSLTPDVNTFIHSLQDGRIPPFCRIKFSYPGPSADLENEKCYTHAVKTCLPHFTIPPDLEMTRDEVEAACLSNFSSPYFYFGIYANVFCYICSQPLPLTFIHNRCQEDDGRTLTGIYALISIVSFNFIEKIRPFQTRNIKSSQHLVCRTNQSKKDCRYLYCPSGQVNIGLGKCAFPDGEMRFAVITTALKLTPTKSLPASRVKHLVNNYTFFEDKTFIESPWGYLNIRGDLNIRACYYVLDYSTELVDYILMVEHLSSGEQFRLQTLVDNVGKTLSQHWNINFPEEPVELEQSFSFTANISKIKIARSLTNSPDRKNQLPAFMANMSFPQLHKLINKFSGELSINKMFFCKQISLNQDEYEFYYPAGILYYKPNKRLFYDNEYSLVYDSLARVYVPRLCLSDTVFTLKSESTSINECADILSFLLTLTLSLQN